MPTKYTDATEQMVLEEYRKKVDQEEGVAAYEKSESPDGIIHTNKEKIIGIEVTSAMRTDDSATDPKDKNKVAIFLNKFGLHDPNGPPFSTLSENFKSGEYIQSLLSKIKERIQEKEAKEKYRDFKTRFDKTVLVVYLDDIYVDSCTLESITAQNTFSNLLHVFDEVYLYIHPTYHSSSTGIKHIGGFYLIGQKI